MPSKLLRCARNDSAALSLRGETRRSNLAETQPLYREKAMAVRTGGCLCGAVRYESEGDPIFSLQCHCRDCQRSSGTAFIAAMRVPASGFRITQGEPKRYVGKADSGNAITRAFCGECGSPLYVQVATRPDIVGLRVGTLDDSSE